MSKVGKIYNHKYSTDTIVVVTFEEGDRDSFRVIKRDGLSYKLYESELDIWYNLIVEYPTWQEAVNSPEFRGEK